jgi:hypothetical protein
MPCRVAEEEEKRAKLGGKKFALMSHKFNANSRERIPFGQIELEISDREEEKESPLNRFRKHAKFVGKCERESPICFALFAMQFQLCVA